MLFKQPISGARPEPVWFDHEWMTKCGIEKNKREKKLCKLDGHSLVEPSEDVIFFEFPPQLAMMTKFHELTVTKKLQRIDFNQAVFYTKELGNFLEGHLDRQSWQHMTTDLDNPELHNPAFRAVKAIYQLLSVHLEHNGAPTSPSALMRVSSDPSPNHPPHAYINVIQKPALECDRMYAATPTGNGASAQIPLNCFHWLVLIPDPPHKEIIVRDQDFHDWAIQHKRSPDSFGDRWNLRVLTGFHLMIANEAAWTWATFWWSPTVVRKEASIGNAAAVPWNRYAMASTKYEGKNTVETIVNPYLEGLQTNPAQESNCIFCHSRAVFPLRPSGSIASLGAGELKQPAGSTQWPLFPCYTNTAPHQPTVLPKACDDVRTTHFLWSVADALTGSGK